MIRSNTINEQDVLQALEKQANVYLLNAPDTYANQELFLKEVLQIAQEKEIDAFVSLQYYAVISLLCKTIQKKYIIWVCRAYDPGIYSYTIISAYNYLFLPDYHRYLEFQDVLKGQVFYLPLAANAERILNQVKEEEKTYDLCMVQDIKEISELGNHPLDLQNNLKDATKGYLEGCMSCQYQRVGLPSVAEHLPRYVKEDLFEKFPINIPGDSVESLEHKYDYQYFNPWITMLERKIYFNALAKKLNFENCRLYSDGKAQVNERVECFQKPNYLTELPNIVKQNKINFVIANRNWKAGIPQIAWDIMAGGNFMLGNYMQDAISLFSEQRPMMYDNSIDMLSKAIYYLKHDEERDKICNTLQEEIICKHTYDRRIACILDKL